MTYDERRTAAGVVPTAVVGVRDRVRWGPIFAGLVTALTTFLLLSLLAIGLGLIAADPADPTPEASMSSAVVASLIGLLSFGVGGYVAARTAAVAGRATGALNGFLVWALGIVLLLTLGALGLSALLGAAGDIIAEIGPQNVDPNAVPPTADEVRNSALGGFISLALPALAAALGGALGAPDETVAEVVD